MVGEGGLWVDWLRCESEEDLRRGPRLLLLQAELEAAEAEGRSSVHITLEDGSPLEVPLGDAFATDPATGRHYAITWAQDDAGSLQVLRWTRVDQPSGGGGGGSA